MTKNNQNTKNRRLSSIGLILSIDVAITAISFIASYLICIAIWPELNSQKILFQLPVIIAITSIIFLLYGHTKGVVKYNRSKEVYSIFNAICLVNILTIVLVVIHNKVVTNNENSFLIPLSIIIVHSLLSFIGSVVSRFAFGKLNYSKKTESSKISKVFLAGSGKEAKSLLKAFEKSNEDIIVTGFVNTDKSKIDQREGVEIFEMGQVNQVLLNTYGIEKFIVAKFGDFTSETCDFLLKISTTTTLDILIANYTVKADIEIVFSPVSNIIIEELYLDDNSEMISKERDEFEYFKDKKVLVLGAAGCVGRAFVKKTLSLECKNLMLIDKSDDALFLLEQDLINSGVSNVTSLLADVLDVDRMKQVFSDFNPDLVVNAVGYKIFDFTQENLYEAVRMNILSNKLMVDLSVKNNVKKYVNLSTIIPNVKCSYARASERIAEIYLNCMNEESNIDFVNIRFGNVLESASSVENVFKNQLAKGGPIRVSGEDARVSFISTEELSNLIAEVISISKGGEIYSIDMGDSVSEYDLAKQIIDLDNNSSSENVEIVVAKNLIQEKTRFILNPTMKNTINVVSNDKLSYVKEYELDTALIRSKITDLCLGKKFLNSDIVNMMDDVLMYGLDVNDKRARNNAKNKQESDFDDKIKRLAI